MRTHHDTGANLVQIESVYLNEEIPYISLQFSIYTQTILSTDIYQLHSYTYIVMSAQETTKDGEGGGGETRGFGPCRCQGCTCPAFVGGEPNCLREGCGHSFDCRKISDT
jgi:hypothetical protein